MCMLPVAHWTVNVSPAIRQPSAVRSSLVIVTAADCPHGAAGGVGEHVCALHVGRARCLIAVDADHVTGDQVVEGVEVAQRFAVSTDQLGRTQGLWLAAEE